MYAVRTDKHGTSTGLLGDYSRTEISINRLDDGRYVIAKGATLDCFIGESWRRCFVCNKGRDADEFENSAPCCNYCRAQTKLATIPKRQSAAEKAHAKYDREINSGKRPFPFRKVVTFEDGGKFKGYHPQLPRTFDYTHPDYMKFEKRIR